MVTSEVELLNKIRDEFTSNRAKQEMKVATWATKLSKVDPDILKDIKLPGVITLEAMIPELYKTEPDEEIYRQQWSAFNDLIKQVNELADEYNKEAQRCLSEYQEIV